ncbi:MAG TPA: hypothetical protein VH595_18505 [Verrucomicrobiae bacterium]|jgi:hypothetical protein|nr:hypothetical protein [Verrucomicrobiae bacterium]
MKKKNESGAENSATAESNQGKKVHSAETPSSATPGKDQAQKPALFERDSINLLGEVDDILRCGMPDNTRGALYIMRGHLEELIASGRALAGLPLGEAPKETATVAPSVLHPMTESAPVETRKIEAGSKEDSDFQAFDDLERAVYHISGLLHLAIEKIVSNLNEQRHGMQGVAAGISNMSDPAIQSLERCFSRAHEVYARLSRKPRAD